MSAEMIPDLEGTGLETGPKPVWIQEGPKRVHLVHPDYLKRAHTASDMNAVVTFGGQPIRANGEVLTIGMMLPWRRYAVGPVVNGEAEVLPQHDFEREHEKVYIDSFRFRGERVDDPKVRPIPSVREFVAWKKDPRFPGRICPLGTYTEKQEPIKGAQAYDPLKDEMYDKRAADVQSAIDAQLAEKDKQLAALEAKVNLLAGMVQDKPSKPKKEVEQVTAPCGTWTGAANRLHAHQRFCRSGCKEGA